MYWTDLRKTCPFGGVGFAGFRREDLTRMEGKFRGIETPSELCILPILNFLTDIKIKYYENIVGYIISHFTCHQAPCFESS